MKTVPEALFEDGKAAVDAIREKEFKTDLEVAASIALFLVDPPETTFQRGYLARLKEIFVEMQQQPVGQVVDPKELKVFRFNVTVPFLGIEVTAASREEAVKIINEEWSPFEIIDVMVGTGEYQIEDA